MVSRRRTSHPPSFAWAFLGLAALSGCRHDQAPKVVHEDVPEVALARPVRAAVRWTVQQPGSIEAFEATPIVPRIAGYVEKWDADIGDRVKKGQELAKLWVPDLVAQYERRQAQVQQARKMLEVAEAHLSSSGAAIKEAQAGIGQSRANLGYRKLHNWRANQLVKGAVVNKEVGDQVTNQLQSAEASVREAEARVARVEADHRESEAVRDKVRVDIAVAEAALAETKALVDYARLTAPFDGVVSRRTINTGDYVQPASGRPQEPLYVIERRDTVRIFVEVPEADAVWVKPGTPARINVPVLPDREFEGKVCRTSYALRRQTRSLLAEVDLPNPDDILRPGLYASASLRVERKGLLTLPVSAITSEGNVNEGYRDHCYRLGGGKVHRTRIEVGAHGDDRVQVLKKQVDGKWTDFRGDEAIVAAEIATLTDGQTVRVDTGTAVADGSFTTGAQRHRE